ncbi:MAG TPA: 23S rRNA (adenine(2503)-C(2))-methyltransferase RlmN [Candidatus Aquilonibacter sp.]|jgi:23S rRNA (adenine2503-C2)-methyltransferase|nr:23S rRNA (adenine(2503)-C(2))-methyltransferase RlmN [Candidatus Aquilonibacter sp.]
MSQHSTISLLGMDGAELAALVSEAGEPAYRVKQIMESVYRQRVESLDEISTLPWEFREKLAQQEVIVGAPRIENKFVSVDGTIRYLIGFADGQSVETVWMPEGDGGEAGDGSEAGEEAESSAVSTSGAKAPLQAENLSAALKRCATQKRFSQNRATQDQNSQDQRRQYCGRSTICISSQVGCAVDCQFCLTALLGVKRNLTAGEIAGQVCAVLKDQQVSPPEDRVNLVFMGMGEPFLNYENFIKASRLLVENVGIAERRMTVSTAGIVPRIHDFGREEIRPKLAISLNASNDELRTQLMPLNKKWNLQMLLAAARDFPLRTREWITFEYVLLGGVNDAPGNAKEVAELLRGLRCKVNLIALNPGPGIDFATPSGERVEAFQNTLRAAGIPAFVRRPRGRDIYAACGQLKRTVEAATLPEPPLQTSARALE